MTETDGIHFEWGFDDSPYVLCWPPAPLYDTCLPTYPCFSQYAGFLLPLNATLARRSHPSAMHSLVGGGLVGLALLGLRDHFEAWCHAAAVDCGCFCRGLNSYHTSEDRHCADVNTRTSTRGGEQSRNSIEHANTNDLGLECRCTVE